MNSIFISNSIPYSSMDSIDLLSAYCQSSSSIIYHSPITIIYASICMMLSHNMSLLKIYHILILSSNHAIMVYSKLLNMLNCKPPMLISNQLYTASYCIFHFATNTYPMKSILLQQCLLILYQ